MSVALSIELSIGKKKQTKRKRRTAERAAVEEVVAEKETVEEDDDIQQVEEDVDNDEGEECDDHDTEHAPRITIKLKVKARETVKYTSLSELRKRCRIECADRIYRPPCAVVGLQPPESTKDNWTRTIDNWSLIDNGFRISNGDSFTTIRTYDANAIAQCNLDAMLQSCGVNNLNSRRMIDCDGFAWIASDDISEYRCIDILSDDVWLMALIRYVILSNCHPLKLRDILIHENKVITTFDFATLSVKIKKSTNIVLFADAICNQWFESYRTSRDGQIKIHRTLKEWTKQLQTNKWYNRQLLDRIEILLKLLC